jgi:hypothetical protein
MIDGLHEEIEKNSGIPTAVGAYLLTFRAPDEAARVAYVKGWLVALTPGLVQCLVLVVAGGALLVIGFRATRA